MCGLYYLDYDYKVDTLVFFNYTDGPSTPSGRIFSKVPKTRLCSMCVSLSTSIKT